MWRWRLKSESIPLFFYRPRNTKDGQQKPEAKENRIGSCCLQKKPVLLKHWSFSLQNCETVNFCCLNHSIVVLCYDRASKLLQWPYLEIESLYIQLSWRSWDKIIWGLGWVLNHVTGMLRREREVGGRGTEKKDLWGQKQRLELGNREHQDQPEAGRCKEQFSPRVFKGSSALIKPQFWTLGLQNCEKINFCDFKLPNLWQFVMTALGNW